MVFDKRFRMLLPGMALCLALAGCGGKGAPEEEPSDELVESTSSEPEAPEGFVDNSVAPSDYTDDELYVIDGDWILGVKDEAVYYNGKAFTSRFAVNMLTSDGSSGISLGDVEGTVDHIRLGGHEYAFDDLVRSRFDGFQVLSMLAADFGIDRYAADESGNVGLAECMGRDVTGDALREAYSERADFEDYTVCVYYLHAEMNGMDADAYAACREALQEKYGIDHSSILDGTLAVMLYYDVNGYDMFYTIAISAPGYWEDASDYEANMLNHNRHDVSLCHMSVKGVPIGFVNQVFLRCDTAPTDGQDAGLQGGGTEAPEEGGDGNADPDADAGDDADNGDGGVDADDGDAAQDGR